MTHIKKYTLLLSLAVMVYTTHAQEAATTGINISYSLQQAIDYAVQHSPNYLNSGLDQKNAEYRKNEVRGQGLPQITGSFDLKDYLSLPTSLLPGLIVASSYTNGPPPAYIPVKFGTQFNATAGLNVSENLNSDYFFGLSAAKEYINLSRINVNRSKVDLVAQVSKAYYGVVIARQRMKLLDVNIAKTKINLDQTTAMVNQGLKEKIDAESIEVQYNNLMTDKQRTLQLILVSEGTLKFQMGYTVTDPIALSDSLNIETATDANLNPGALDFNNRPDYQALKAQQHLYEIDVKRRKWGYLPSLTIYGNYSFQKQRNQFDIFGGGASDDPTNKWFKIAYVGATLNFNFFDGLQRHYQIQQAKMTSQKNLNTIRGLELQSQLEANTASINYSNAFISVTNQRKNMELANHIYDVTQKKFTGGVGTNQEVIIAESQLRDAQNNFFNAVYDLYMARIDYQKSLGGLVK